MAADKQEIGFLLMGITMIMSYSLYKIMGSETAQVKIIEFHCSRKQHWSCFIIYIEKKIGHDINYFIYIFISFNPGNYLMAFINKY